MGTLTLEGGGPYVPKGVRALGSQRQAGSRSEQGPAR